MGIMLLKIQSDHHNSMVLVRSKNREVDCEFSGRQAQRIINAYHLRSGTAQYRMGELVKGKLNIASDYSLSGW